MKTESVGHHAATQALVLSVAGGDGHYADRKFDCADLVLSTRLAQTAKPSAAPTPDGFAFVPIRAEFLDSIRRAVETAVKSNAAAALHSQSPSVPRQGR